MPKLLNTTITLNSKGQLVLPKWLRTKKKLSTGSKFRIRISNEEIILIPYKLDSFLEKWRGSMPEIDLEEGKKEEKNRDNILDRLNNLNSK